jgi:hypothetical protein
MRKTILVLMIAVAAAAAFTSCASSSRSGCAMSAGYVGYGHAVNR